MKRLQNLLPAAALLISSIIVISSCEEIIIPIVGESFLIDSTYVTTEIPAPQQRMVLIEDFSGVQCVNCPIANAKAQEILDAHPDQAAVITLHNYFIGGYPNSSEDLRTEEAYAIDNLLGPTSLWPIGAVDRVKYSDVGVVLVDDDTWATRAEGQMAETPVVNVVVEANYRSEDRTLEALATLTFLQDLTDQIRVSVMLTESEIIDPQLTPDGIDDVYSHNHVLRTMPTPATGSPITETTEEGRVIIRGWEIPLEDHWNDAHLEVVVFVHKAEADDLEVLQVAKIHI